MHVLLIHRKGDITIKQERSLVIINHQVVVGEVVSDNLNLKKGLILMRYSICSLVVASSNHIIDKREEDNSINNNNAEVMVNHKVQYSSLWDSSFPLSSLFCYQWCQILHMMVENHFTKTWENNSIDFHLSKATTIHTSKFLVTFTKYTMWVKIQSSNLTIIEEVR